MIQEQNIQKLLDQKQQKDRVPRTPSPANRPTSSVAVSNSSKGSGISALSSPDDDLDESSGIIIIDNAKDNTDDDVSHSSESDNRLFAGGLHKKQKT